MRKVEPVLVAHLFAPLHAELLALLRGLTPAEWNAPTVAGAWTVKDVAGHLLDTNLRRLSLHRDGHQPPPFTSFDDINQTGVAFARRLSPAVLIDQHERYGAEMNEFLASLDPYAPAKWSVSWAGEEESQNWFDVARELTERWHHQRQIRDAVGRPPLYDYLAPVLDTFVRAVPYTYRGVEGTVVLRIDDAVWSLVDGALYAGEARDPAATVTMTGDAAWRLFTKQKIDPKARVEGDARLAEPLLRMLAIVI
ncbi:MAG TPA: maleylpyruvate isomerase N-terminal domain-containing protein [Thermoanaerobaculia bacterium]|jgi:uncharacterized protein (TIGR03083 family)